MRVLVIGGGGREHALAWKLRQSPSLERPGDLLCVPGNPGIGREAVLLPAPRGGLADVAALAEVAREHRADLVVVGPELPLTLGLADLLEERGMAVFGASSGAARLEGSKVFAKRFMARHGIPTASFEVFETASEALDYLGAPERAFPIVVKADGLAAGKGVVVAADRDEAASAVRAMMQDLRFGPAGARVVIETCLEGVEASFFALCDGERAVPLATCQDYKRALDGDEGPNTGGMGACSPSIDLDDADQAAVLERAVLPVLRGMREEGTPFRGILYAGLMLTPEPMVLEYNARFGDPEAQALMPRLESDLVQLLAAAAAGRLDRTASPRWKPGASACVVLASRGYPASSESGRTIEGIEEAERLPGTVVFHAGTGEDADGRVVTTGGRVLAVAATGADLAEAVDRAYRGASCVRFDGMHYRSDIGQAAVVRLASRDSAGKGRGGERR